MDFVVDPRIASSCVYLSDWPLSRVFLKNNQSYPWLILVPRQASIQEVDQLTVESRHQLIDEISALSLIIKEYFQPDKINVGSLGNMVSQLHVHVIARFIGDTLWPYSVWQASQHDMVYPADVLERLTMDLKKDLFRYFA